MQFVHPPGTLAGRDLVIFDGTCGFCTWSVRQLPRFGVHAAAMPFQRLTPDDLRALGVSRDACAERVHFVDATGAVSSGADALNAMLRGRGFFGLVTQVIARTPMLLRLERRGYDWVAHHRVAISRLLGTRRFAVIAEDDARTRADG